MDDAVEPYRDVIGRSMYPLLDEIMKTLGFPPGLRTPEATGWLARLMAWNTVASYWSEHPLRGKYLPRIATRGLPWDLLPDEIHVLDLPPEQSRRALRESRFLQDLSQLTSHPPEDRDGTPTLSISDELVSAAIHEIRFGRAEAFFNPLVVVVTYELLKTAHYSPRLEERRQAVGRLVAVFGAFAPDLSQHISRREDQLVPRLEAYETLSAALDPLLRDLRAQGPTTALVDQFRACVDPRVTPSQLKRWSKTSASTLAMAVVAGRCRLSPKTLADQLTLARTARRIQNAWGNYQATIPPTAASAYDPSSPPSPPGGPV